MGSYYEKRPEVVEAHRWDGAVAPFAAFIGEGASWYQPDGADRIFVDTGDGGEYCPLYDYVVRDATGKVFVMAKDAFEAAYIAPSRDRGR